MRGLVTDDSYLEVHTFLVACTVQGQAVIVVDARASTRRGGTRALETLELPPLATGGPVPVSQYGIDADPDAASLSSLR